MYMPVFTTQTLIDTVRETASEKPDFVYRPSGRDSRCSYVRGLDGVGCIVGQALERIGFDGEAMAQLDSYGSVNTLIASMKIRGVVTADETETEFNENSLWLSRVQTAQDLAAKWDDAIRYADGELSRDELHDTLKK